MRFPWLKKLIETRVVSSTLEHALIGQVITAFHVDGDDFRLRLRSGKVVYVNPLLGFAWRVGRLRDEPGPWVSARPLRIDRLGWFQRHQRHALRLECACLDRIVSIKILPDRSGGYRLVFPRI